MHDILQRVVKEHGTPCFVYFMDQAYERIEAIERAFGGLFRVSYAMKCNPHPEILRRLMNRVSGLDISSGGELAIATDIGWPPHSISFTGPAKRYVDLQESVSCRIGDVIVESVHEASQLNEIASTAEIRQRILIRISPNRVPRGFGVNMAGKPCQFGIDEENLDAAIIEIKAMSNLNLVGFHIYSGTQCLKPDSICENFQIFAELFKRFSDQHDISPEKLIFGSGIGIPYHDGDEPVNLAPIADTIIPMLKELKLIPRFSSTEFVLETGRFLIGEAGIYLTSVVNRKRSRGKNICVFNGGMNHHLGACGHLGMVLQRNYRMFKVCSENADSEEQLYDLFGPLCTSIDTLGRQVPFPGLDIGDVIGIHCSGAYGITSSPINFISHDLPTEVVVETQNGELLIERIGSHGKGSAAN